MRNPFTNPSNEQLDEEAHEKRLSRPIPLDKIKTSNICPPIPTRSFDWVAWIDGMEEHGPQGLLETGTLEKMAGMGVHAPECREIVRGRRAKL